jgi:uncharacterized membrane protein YkvA (DUF1232 family)
MTEEEKYKELVEEQSDNPIEATSLWKKIAKYAKKMGLKSVYSALLLYYAYRRKDTPAWAKRVITGVLAYFIAPIDAIPDLTPFIGFTDDLGVLGFGLATIAVYINKEVRLNARTQLEKWFENIDQKELDSVDKTL